MSIRTKFLLLLCVTALAAMAYVHLLVIPIIGNHATDIAKRGHASQLSLTAEAITPPLLESDIANVYELLDAIRYDNPSWLQLELFDPKGNRLYPLSAPETLPGDLVTLTLEHSVGFFDPAIAQLKVTIDLGPTIIVANHMERLLLSAISVVLLVLLVAIWFEIEIIIRRPINMMVSAAKQMVGGDYRAQLPLEKKGEIGELAASFYDMRRTIQRHHINMASELEYERKRAEELHQEKFQAEFYATHDMLTGLLNRRAFERQLAIALDSVQSGAVGASSLLYIDLDHFKAINDTCGHHAGDELLRQVSQLVRSTIRSDDTFARLGGDEFAVLLQGCEESAALRVASSICQSVHTFVFDWEGHSYSIGSSIGVTQLRRSHENINAVMADADVACYASKRGGRNRVSLADLKREN